MKSLKSLNEIADEVVKESGSIELEKALEGYKIHKSAREYMFQAPYFRCLSAYCKLYDVKCVLEIGTCTGASAVAMAHHAKKVDTFDVEVDDIDQSLEDKNINFYMLMDSSHCLEINLDPYDLIFIDIDHRGDMELKLHAKLANEYKGIAFYDDIFLNPEMIKFWDIIEQPKVALPWHLGGFGMVRY